MEVLFWMSAALVLYAYFGYPIFLGVLARVFPRPIVPPETDYTPFVSLVVPVYNEEAIIARKLENTFALDYPADQMQIILISDGSTDGTDEIAKEFATESRIEFIRVPHRSGKANALNSALEIARGDVVVFSDASIMLDSMALREIVCPFSDPSVGCVSGEDHIQGGGGEGLYGRYELYLRNKESAIHSIVGASGSFYAKRRRLLEPFLEGLAPDFLSVLITVEKGYRALSEPTAFGFMTAVPNAEDEFRRKVRTILRGITTLWFKKRLLNPVKYGWFSFELLSHKVARWLVPVGLISLLISNFAIADSLFYGAVLVLQVAFYGVAFLSWRDLIGVAETVYGKIALYFTASNLAVLVAWIRFLGGTRQELWEPSRRSG